MPLLPARSAYAIKAFQRSIGRPETGLLMPYDTARLTEACEEKKRRVGWAPYQLAHTNITIELPLGILALKEESPETQRETLRFMGLGGNIGIWVYHTLQPHPGYMSSIYSAIEHMSDAQVNYKVWKETGLLSRERNRTVVSFTTIAGWMKLGCSVTK